MATSMGQKNIMLRRIVQELKDHRFLLCACPTKTINVLEERVKYWLTETGKKREAYWREGGQDKQQGKEFLVLHSITEHQ